MQRKKISSDFQHRPAFRLYLITDRKLSAPRDLVSLCKLIFDAAAEANLCSLLALQLREKDLSARELYDLATRLSELCHKYNVPLLVNERLDVALAVDADGVHLPAASLPIGRVREVVGESKLIGASTHNLDEVLRAYQEGADFAVFGPVYKPLSKSIYLAPRGPEELARVCKSIPLPIYALGGITADHICELAKTGAAGVAVIGSVMGSPSPERASLKLLELLNQCGRGVKSTVK